MNVGVIAVVMIVAIIVIAIVIYKSISSGSKSKSESPKKKDIEITVDRTDHGSTGGTLHIPKVPLSNPTPPQNDGHDVHSIYTCVWPTNIWVCAECECENDNSRNVCCVCRNQR